LKNTSLLAYYSELFFCFFSNDAVFIDFQR